MGPGVRPTWGTQKDNLRQSVQLSAQQALVGGSQYVQCQKAVVVGGEVACGLLRPRVLPSIAAITAGTSSAPSILRTGRVRRWRLQESAGDGPAMRRCPSNAHRATAAHTAAAHGAMSTASGTNPIAAAPKWTTISAWSWKGCLPM